MHFVFGAERKTGQLLKDSDKAQGTRLKPGGNVVRPPEPEKTLNDIGISKDQSSRWQKLADVSDKAKSGPDESGQRSCAATGRANSFRYRNQHPGYTGRFVIEFGVMP